MAGGAIGFATSASPTHNGDHGRPVPSRVADLDELRRLLGPVRDADRGVVALLPGGVFTQRRRCSTSSARSAGPFTWTALLTIEGFPYHEKVIAEHDAARADGVEVWPQVSCRPLVFQMNLAEPFTLNMRPTFAELMDSPLEERMAAYRDPAWRETAWAELSGGGGVLPVNWASLSVAESAAPTPSWSAASVVDIAAEQGVHPARRDARPLARGRPDDPLLVRARQRRPRGHRLAAAPGQRAARPGRLRART